MTVDDMAWNACAACGEQFAVGQGEAVAEDWVCQSCMCRYPSLLIVAATGGEGDYALGLRGGVEVHFTSAELIHVGDYVRVTATESFGSDADNLTWTKIPGLPREVDIRLSEIVWCVQQ